jgi:hypothetical protein
LEDQANPDAEIEKMLAMVMLSVYGGAFSSNYSVHTAHHTDDLFRGSGHGQLCPSRIDLVQQLILRIVDCISHQVLLFNNGDAPSRPSQSTGGA